MKNILIFIILLFSLNIKANEGCWVWKDMEIETPQAGDYDGSFIVYDEKLEKIALFLTNEQEKKVNLWYFDGEKWEFDSTSKYEFYGPILFMYYDENIDSICVFSSHYAGPEMGWLDMHRFDRMEKKFYLINSIGSVDWSPSGVPSLAYDSNRKRAVIAGMFKYGTWEAVTVEFDGSNFYIIDNPEGIYLNEGVSAYDIENKKVVYFGYNDISSHSDKYETFEYDGAKWEKAEGAEMLRSYEWFPILMIYYQIEKKIILISQHMFYTYFYKDKKWQKMNILNYAPLDSWWPFIAYNSKIEKIISYAYYKQSDRIFELKKSKHCRPF